jgi:hypothetical protein
MPFEIDGGLGLFFFFEQCIFSPAFLRVKKLPILSEPKHLNDGSQFHKDKTGESLPR